MNYGIDRFGASGNGPVVIEKLGFTAEKIAEAYLQKFVHEKVVS